jgi:hypothetical protein
VCLSQSKACRSSRGTRLAGPPFKPNSERTVGNQGSDPLGRVVAYTAKYLSGSLPEKSACVRRFLTKHAIRQLSAAKLARVLRSPWAAVSPPAGSLRNPRGEEMGTHGTHPVSDLRVVEPSNESGRFPMSESWGRSPISANLS